jgi:hypothetical protein
MLPLISLGGSVLIALACVQLPLPAQPQAKHQTDCSLLMRYSTVHATANILTACAACIKPARHSQVSLMSPARTCAPALPHPPLPPCSCPAASAMSI